LAILLLLLLLLLLLWLSASQSGLRTLPGLIAESPTWIWHPTARLRSESPDEISGSVPGAGEAYRCWARAAEPTIA
jgi:hypothetical protein